MRTPPVSNLERQRQFRARHPGYFGKYKTSAKEGRRLLEVFEAERCAAVESARMPTVAAGENAGGSVAESAAGGQAIEHADYVGSHA